MPDGFLPFLHPTPVHIENKPHVIYTSTLNENDYYIWITGILYILIRMKADAKNKEKM